MQLASVWERLRRGKDPATKANTPLHPFDQRYGVETGGLIQGSDLKSGHANDAFNTAYYAMAPSRFQQVMGYWIADETHPPLQDYSFVDLGCGKGRAVMMASEFSFRQVVGVELHPALARIAKTNITAWAKARRPACPMRIVRQDATEFAFPRGACLLYLFNPFAAPVVQRVIERIEAEFTGRPGLLDLMYFNPDAEELLDAHPGFELLWTGTMALSEEDQAADPVVSPDDICSVYRWVGLANAQPCNPWLLSV
jgi:SAM-dependent methyltransferase